MSSKSLLFVPDLLENNPDKSVLLQRSRLTVFHPEDTSWTGQSGWSEINPHLATAGPSCKVR